MDKDILYLAVVELLFDLYRLDKLDISVLDSISKNFNVDAIEICENQGITYKLN